MIQRFILSVTAVFLLASCANKFSLVKRKYNKGYHFSVAKNHSVKKQQTKGDELTVGTLDPKQISLQAEPEADLKSSPVNTPEQIASAPKHAPSVKKQKTTETPASSEKDSEEEVHVKNFASVLQKQDFDSDSGLSKGADGDVKLILLIILAIFIPPLAVYLKNESIDKWFWITLILCLLSLSVFFFAFGGLGWFVAMVIAILYVLDFIK